MKKVAIRKAQSIRKFSLLLAALFAASLLSVAASASGSFGPSNGSGLQGPYNLGKQVYHKKIACDSCPLPSKKLTMESANKVIQKLNTRKDLMELLKAKERKAAIYYLKKRHKLS